MNGRRVPHLFAALGAACLLLATSVARADDGANLQAAQALHDKAVALMAQKNYDEACPKLEEVTRLVPDGIGAKLSLAECYEAQGKLASAWGQYVTVEQLAARQSQGERQRQAAEGAARLKPKLAYLTIRVPEPVRRMPQLVVRRGPLTVGAGQFDEAIPIDRGKHQITAIAAGKKQWNIEVDIPADGATLAVDVPVLEDDPNARLTNLPPSGSAADDGWLIPVGFVVGGVGAAALIAGGALGGVAMGRQSDAEELCPRGFCSAEGNDARREAGTFADASTGLLIGGGALAGAGVIMLALAPWGSSSSEKSASAFDLGPIDLHLGPTSVGLFGRF